MQYTDGTTELIQYTDGTIELMTNTRTKQLQDFYWLKYEELWDEDKMGKLWVSKEHLEEIKKIRGTEAAKKDTVWFELAKWVMNSEQFKKIKDFYGITLEDTQDIEKMKSKWVKDEDIEFITGKKLSSNNTDNGSENKKAKRSTTKSSKTTK